METLVYFAGGLAVGVLCTAVAMEVFVSFMHGFFPQEPYGKADRVGLSALFVGFGAFAAMRPGAIGLDAAMRPQLGAMWLPALYGTAVGFSAVAVLFMFRRLGRW